MKEEKDALKPFLAHGLNIVSEIGDQAVADCPFCGKTKHFYVGKETGLWDCKVCGQRGNAQTFLTILAGQLAKELKGPILERLVEDRGIPAETLQRWGVGWNGKRYTIPVRNSKGTVIDLRLYGPGYKTISTSGCSTGLVGGERLPSSGHKVYVCEGEWDAMALDALSQRLKKGATVVGVPGAGTFKSEWVPLFQGKEVITFYDNDEAGENGERLAMQRMTGTARAMKFVHWPEDAPIGFDVRDWVKYGLRIGKPSGCWDNLHKLLQNSPRKMEEKEKIAAREEESAPESIEGTLSAEGVFRAYRDWLQIEDLTVLKVLFGACFANRLEGDPVWLFLVAPPGGMKSELLMSLKLHSTVYATTSLTPHALVSGSSWIEGKDPSLLPKLDGKLLVIKDFTTILTMHYSQRDEIFGIIRDAYDGTTGKNFGNGIRREYNVKFGIIAGVTDKIEAFSIMHQSLGERFLKFRTTSSEKRESDEQRIIRALSNVNQEVAMRKYLCEAGAKCLNRELPELIPELDPSILVKLVALAQMVAMMRGVVERDRFDKTVQYRPSYEIGTRLAKQFAKLAIGIAIFLEHDHVGEEEYQIIKQVAHHTAPDRVEILLKELWKLSRNSGDSFRTHRISEVTHLPQATVFRLLEDLELLRLVDKSGDGTKNLWKLSNKLLGLIDRSEIYKEPDTSNLAEKRTNLAIKRAVVRFAS